MVIDGGIKIPSVPAVANEPKANFSLYPRFISSGKATLLIVAQVAAEEPETEPKMPQPKMVVCIKRPGTRFNQGRNPSNISSLSLVRNKISPIQINKGSAASSQLALLSQNALNKFLPGCVLVKNA